MIDQEEANALYNQAITKWGVDAQIWMAVEEGGEFLAALSQVVSRGRDVNLIEEIADLKIMLEQLSVIFGKAEVDDARQMKLERLKLQLTD